MFKPNLKIPFNSQGMVATDDPYDNIVWFNNSYENLTLKVVESDRYMKSSKLHFEDLYGKRYQMFISDVPDLLTFASINKGIITAEFYFVKRGSDYGIKLRTN